MRRMLLKFRTVLFMNIIILVAVVLFCDNEVLNSVVLQHSFDFEIEEVVFKDDNDNKVDGGNNLPGVVVNNNGGVNGPVLLSNASLDYWAWPTVQSYVITSYFGYRWGSMHNAIDISSGYGSEIYAANNGVVSVVKGGCAPGYTACNGSGGNYVVINHNSNNYYTIYMHLKDINVSEGQVVSRGQVIGTMGNTGNVVPVPTTSNPTGGTHLHFGLYIGEPFKGGYAVDPMRLY